MRWLLDGLRFVVVAHLRVLAGYVGGVAAIAVLAAVAAAVAGGPVEAWQAVVVLCGSSVVLAEATRRHLAHRRTRPSSRRPR